MNSDMEAERNQDLSALLDGELDPERSRFLLQRLGHDNEMRQRWARWQLMSACLKGEPVQLLPADFAERVRVGLDAQPPLQSRPRDVQSMPVRPIPSRWTMSSARLMTAPW